MKHQEYTQIIREKVPLLKNKNILFWNLWCLTYIFEKINNYDNKHYEAIKECYHLLWSFHDSDSSHLLINLFDNESVKKIINIDNNDYANLDDLNLNDKRIKEMIGGLECILLDLKDKSNVTYNANTHVINVLDIEMDGIHISKDNTDKMYLKETGAHISLLNDLISKNTNHTFKDKNIYR